MHTQRQIFHANLSGRWGLRRGVGSKRTQPQLHWDLRRIFGSSNTYSGAGKPTRRLLHSTWVTQIRKRHGRA